MVRLEWVHVAIGFGFVFGIEDLGILARALLEEVKRASPVGDAAASGLLASDRGSWIRLCMHKGDTGNKSNEDD